MSEARLKRKIDLSNISAITVSKFGPEFVIHVNKEYDYRFCSENDKIQILSVLTKTILKETPTKQLMYYLSDQLYLETITKTKFDDKKKVSRASFVDKNEILMVDLEYF